MQNIDLNSGDWKETNKPMYYSQQKRSWYCKECNFLTQSPRTAGAHAEEHELPLPFSRNKIEVELVPVAQKKKTEPLNSQTSNFQSYSTPANLNRIYRPPPRSGRADPEELKRWVRQQAEEKISVMRWLECTEEQIEKAKVEFGLKTRQEYLMEKEERLKEKEAVKHREQIDALYLMKVGEVPDPVQQVNLLMQYSILRQM